jgi:glyceraldehyde-3-phosphate dehydrogenase (NADP+)
VGPHARRRYVVRNGDKKLIQNRYVGQEASVDQTSAPRAEERRYDMRMFLGGEWVDRDERSDVVNPYDGSVIDTVPRASLEDVEKAIPSAVRGAAVMAELPAYQRYRILHRAAELMEERAEDLGRTITLEEGKIIAEGRGEAQRSIQTMILSAEEAKRLYGENLPLDAAPGVTGKVGFTVCVPCGVVVAISPFNFPLNLVCHKVGPALAAGNAVIVKPASDTPLSALKLTEILLEAGLPPEAIQCVTGSGGALGGALCADPRVRKITFTGSRDIGEGICRVAGLKKVTMELGSNSPLIVMPDADLEKAAAATAATGFSNAGQVCISTQRVLVHEDAYGDFLNTMTPVVEGISVGDPTDESVMMGR